MDPVDLAQRKENGQSQPTSGKFKVERTSHEATTIASCQLQFSEVQPDAVQTETNTVQEDEVAASSPVKGQETTEV